MGAARHERGKYERAAIAARWTGWLAQADPRKQPSVDKMMGKQAERRVMSGKEIGGAMRAWARRNG